MGSLNLMEEQYKRALVTIRTLESSVEFYRQQLSDIEAKEKKIDKNVRSLCETILKKDRELAKESKQSVWFQKDLIDIILLAQESIERYFPSISGLMNAMQKKNAERTQEIIRLKKQIKDEKEMADKKYAEMIAIKDKTIQELYGRIGNGNVDEASINEIKQIIDSSSSSMTDLNIDCTSGITEISEEEMDGIASSVMVDLIEETYTPHKKPREIKKGIKLKTTKATQEKIKTQKEKKQEKQDVAYMQMIVDIQSSIKPVEANILRVIGDTGVSDSEKIVAKMREMFPEIRSDSNIRTSLFSMKQGDNPLIRQASCPTPRAKNFSVYEMTDIGRDIYRMQFAKEPVESEAEIIRRNHTTLEHGYGIKDTATMLMETQAFSREGIKVNYLTRNSGSTAKIDNTTRYVPDIIILVPKNNREPQKIYFEYETGLCSTADFIEKCNKMALITNYLNFIVPSKPVLEQLQEKTEKWAEQLNAKRDAGEFPFSEQKVVRISTYNALKESAKRANFSKWEWEFDKTITPPKKAGSVQSEPRSAHE